MSSAVYLSFDDGEGIDAGQWAAFCSRHGIIHGPRTVGGNVFYAGDVEVTFGEGLPGCVPEYAEHVTFSTYYFGTAKPQVADLARAFWLEFGGAMSADPELRPLLVRDAGDDNCRPVVPGEVVGRQAAPTRPGALGRGESLCASAAARAVSPGAPTLTVTGRALSRSAPVTRR